MKKQKQVLELLIYRDSYTGLCLYQPVSDPEPSPARKAAAYLGGSLAVIIVVCLVVGLLP